MDRRETDRMSHAYGGGDYDDTARYSRRRYPYDASEGRSGGGSSDYDRRWRRGGSGHHQRGGGGGGRRSVVRTSPPPPGTIRLSDRPIAHSQWDVRAPGFEAVDALSAKATGLFGAPVNSGSSGMMMYGIRGAMPGTIPPSAMAELEATTSAAAFNASMYLETRRLHVSPVSSVKTSQQLRIFINDKMNERLLCSSGSLEPCYAVDMHLDEGYAYLEFRNPDEASNALLLDGVAFLGHRLHIERPKGYVGQDAVPAPGAIETSVPDGPNKLYIGNVPVFLNEQQVMELLKAFGDVRHFDLIRDPETQRSRGMAFCEFQEDAVTDLACEGLDGLEVGEQRLMVRRVNASTNTHTHEDTQETSDTPTRAMLMLNMVTTDELLDDTEYQDIKEDVHSECSRHGTVTSVYIPRPLAAAASHATSADAASGMEPKGVGRVYVQFVHADECEAALRAIAGRQFDGRTVICAYVRDDAWPQAAAEAPAA